MSFALKILGKEAQFVDARLKLLKAIEKRNWSPDFDKSF